MDIDKLLRKNFGPLMLTHVMKDERIREYRALEDTIDACRENMLVNQWNAELGYYEFPEALNAGEIKTEGHIVGFEHAVPICEECLKLPGEKVYEE